MLSRCGPASSKVFKSQLNETGLGRSNAPRKAPIRPPDGGGKWQSQMTQGGLVEARREREGGFGERTVGVLPVLVAASVTLGGPQPEAGSGSYAGHRRRDSSQQIWRLFGFSGSPLRQLGRSRREEPPVR